VVKRSLSRLLKLLVCLIMLVFCWGKPAIAAYPVSAPDTPDDLQSLVMQAADRLDLPMFPLNELGSNVQQQTQEPDSLEDDFWTIPFGKTPQSPQQQTLEPAAPRTLEQP
jgi:hypothetical protein